MKFQNGFEIIKTVTPDGIPNGFVGRWPDEKWYHFETMPKLLKWMNKQSVYRTFYKKKAGK